MQHAKFKQNEDFLKFLSLCIFMAMSLILVIGCGTVKFRAGKSFNAELMDKTLKVGESNGAQVKAALGEPIGKGRALMPFHEAPKKVYTYYYETGNFDLGSGSIEDSRKYLFIFIDEDTYEGYMWFESQHLK